MAIVHGILVSKVTIKYTHIKKKKDKDAILSYALLIGFFFLVCFSFQSVWHHKCWDFLSYLYQDFLHVQEKWYRNLNTPKHQEYYKWKQVRYTDLWSLIWKRVQLPLVFKQTYMSVHRIQKNKEMWISGDKRAKNNNTSFLIFLPPFQYNKKWICIWALSNSDKFITWKFRHRLATE